MYRHFSAAVVGSINMDLILRMDRVPETGENVLGSSYGYANGGKGANQAVGLARLGAKTKMIGKVCADENGRTLLAHLLAEGVDVSGVSTDGSQTGLAAILLDGAGKNRIVVFECANAEIDPEAAARCLLPPPDLLLVQFETREDVVVSCVNEAVKNGVTTVIDCGPAKNFALEKMPGADILSPNESETLALTGIYPSDDGAVRKACEILSARSKARYVVLKLGARGCAVWDGRRLQFLPAYETKVVDTTAAGDCFTAAMALEYKRTGDIIAACDMGNRAGSIAVSRLGAADSMPTAEELYK
ncbi:MAG: ribokinase [Clostridia bacterium]|nr:ribokinase [Clostridia bacterium]